MILPKEQYLQGTAKNLSELYDQLAAKPRLKLDDFDPSSTALVIVDMINGFVKEGPLSSENALKIVPQITEFLKTCSARGFSCLFFADRHTEKSPEFGAYPVHCLAGTEQCEPVSEIAEAGGYRLIYKNSTNGCQEPEFQRWLEENGGVSNFLITGCCTDICVLQFALSLKTEFNRRNRASRIIVPMDLSATYDAPGHIADFIDLVSFYNMHTNGIEVTPEIEY